MHGLLGVELPLEEVGDLQQVNQVKIDTKTSLRVQSFVSILLR
jgi:hypothetical protein